MPRVKIKSFGWAASRNQLQHRLKFVVKIYIIIIIIIVIVIIIVVVVVLVILTVNVIVSSSFLFIPPTDVTQIT